MSSSDGRIRTFVRGIKIPSSEPAVLADAASCVVGDSESEQDGMGANGRHLAVVGGTDRDRLALRSVAAAALGMLDVGDFTSAEAILRNFLART